MDEKARLDLALRLLERSDGRRDAHIQRASVVLSVAALLVAGVSVLLGIVSSEFLKKGFHVEKVLFLSFGVGSIALLLSAIVFATNAIANVWKTSRQQLGSQMPSRLLFYPRQTLARFGSYPELLEFVRGANESEITDNVLGHFWAMLKEQFVRYQRIRKATRLLILAVIPFAAGLAVFLVVAIRVVLTS